MTVLPIGASVIVGDGIQAFVTGICIRAVRNVTYECSWWNEREHVCEWLEEIEVVPEGVCGNPFEIGFLAGQAKL